MSRPILMQQSVTHSKEFFFRPKYGIRFLLAIIAQRNDLYLATSGLKETNFHYDDKDAVLVLEFHINHFVWLSEEYSPFIAVFNLFITPRPGLVRNRGKTLDETFLVPPTVCLVRCGIGRKLMRDLGLRINYGRKRDVFLGRWAQGEGVG